VNFKQHYQGISEIFIEDDVRHFGLFSPVMILTDMQQILYTKFGLFSVKMIEKSHIDINSGER